MRTTLTIDDDVAAMLEQLRKKRGAVALKSLSNEALSGVAGNGHAPKTALTHPDVVSRPRARADN